MQVISLLKENLLATYANTSQMIGLTNDIRLNNYLIKCKATLSALCNDLKIGKVKTEKEYRELI